MRAKTRKKINNLADHVNNFADSGSEILLSENERPSGGPDRVNRVNGGDRRIELAARADQVGVVGEAV